MNYHRVIGVTHFYLFVDGVAARPEVLPSPQPSPPSSSPGRESTFLGPYLHDLEGVEYLRIIVDVASRTFEALILNSMDAIYQLRMTGLRSSMKPFVPMRSVSIAQGPFLFRLWIFSGDIDLFLGSKEAKVSEFDVKMLVLGIEQRSPQGTNLFECKAVCSL